MAGAWRAFGQRPRFPALVKPQQRAPENGEMTGCLEMSNATEEEKRESDVTSKRSVRCQATPNRRAIFLVCFGFIAGNCKSPLAL